MQRLSLITLIALFVLGPLATAGEECKKTAATEEKVTKLLGQWKELAAKDATACAKSKAKLQAEFQAMLKESPLGSRMGSTLGFINKVLASTLAAEQACAKSCASAKSDGKQKSTCDLSRLVAARRNLLANLGELTTHALAALPGSECNKSVACEKAAPNSGPLSVLVLPGNDAAAAFPG